MRDDISSNKRIAKNTVLLYIRTAVVLFISLYTSRLMLKALGAEDLGIYNVVGGIVALMVFFRSSLSKSTSRFITYELGEKGDCCSLNRIFSSAMTIHIMIAVLVMVLGESVGIYILNNWTDIPETRQLAAFWVFHCSLAVFCFQLLTTPYESIIIAHENMSVFAYMSILSALLKLGIVYVLLGSSTDRLILYGIMMVVMDSLILLLYFLYVKRKYPIYKFRFLWDKNYSRRMFAFSGWTLLGSSANAATQQGVSLLFNNFVGLVANTALGFANQVNGAVVQFVNSFQTAFNPQIIKLYAQKEVEKMHLLMSRASKISFILAYVLALPLIANMDFILHIWLGNVPQYTTEFCQLILISCVIDSTTSVFNTAITATGNIRGFQIGISVSFFLDLLSAAALLLLHQHPALVFGSRILTRGLINMLIELYFAHKQLSFNIFNYLATVCFPILLTVIVTVPMTWLFVRLFTGWNCLFITCVISLVSCFFITMYVFLNCSEREIVLGFLKRKILR